tara:strand:- start:69 stop:752 length:684 start_codon:yes stop_codon:yes gene_type:complete
LNNWTIVFDLDGTLVDTAPDVRDALNHTIQTFEDRRPLSLKETKDFMGQGARIAMQKALLVTGHIPDSSIIDNLTSDFIENYSLSPVKKTTVYPLVCDTLNKLIKDGANLGICTNKPSKTALPVLSKLGLDKFFNTIICGDQTDKQKPDPTHILDTIRSLNGEPGQSIMVGDTENDIKAALAIPIPSVAVTFGYSAISYQSLGATVLIDGYDSLQIAIAEIIANKMG